MGNIFQMLFCWLSNTKYVFVGDKDKLSKAGAFGIGIGVMIAVVIMITAIVFLVLRRRKVRFVNPTLFPEALLAIIVKQV